MIARATAASAMMTSAMMTTISAVFMCKGYAGLLRPHGAPALECAVSSAAVIAY
jgi:hypothetical protein